MIKYLLTQDAIVIPEIKLTLSREDLSFSKLLDLCKKKDTTLDDIMFAKPDLSYENKDLSISMTSASTAEIFFNSEYYDLPLFLVEGCLSAIKNSCNYKNEYLANFLIKCFKNNNYPFEDLLIVLRQKNFIFLPNGNVLLYKMFDSKRDEKLINKSFEYEPIRLLSWLDITRTSLVEVNPTDINDGYVSNFITRGEIGFPALSGGIYSVNFKHNLYYKCLKNENIEDRIINMNSILGKNIEEVLTKEQIDFFKNYDEDSPSKFSFQNLSSIINKLCMI